MNDQGVERIGIVSTDADCEPRQGTLFAGRYRLLDPCHSSEDVSGRPRHWRGFDEVLNRPVLVTVLLDDSPEGANLLASAVANGRVADPGIASVFDAANVDGCTYVVSEWVDGTTLGELLREQGPLPSARAAAVVQAAAETVASLHEQGLVHGNLDPGNVLLTTDGGVKLTSLRTSTDTDAHADVRRLGALLYAALTGRWPAAAAGCEARAMPPAPYEGGRLCEPRQVRAGVTGTLSLLAMRALDPVRSGITAGRLADVLVGPAAAPAELPFAADLDPATSGRSWRRGAVLVGALLVISLAGLLVGFSLGAIKTPAGSYYPSFGRGNKTAPSPPQTKPAAQTGGQAVVGARILDPEGNGTETRHADLAWDGDPKTAWRTEDYKRPRFGNFKHGMGILFDLGQSRSVRSVTVDVTEAGGQVELRSGDTSSDSPDAYRTIETSPSVSGRTLTFNLPSATQARYWLVWITLLPPHNNGYGDGIAEVTFS